MRDGRELTVICVYVYSAIDDDDDDECLVSAAISRVREVR